MVSAQTLAADLKLPIKVFGPETDAVAAVPVALGLEPEDSLVEYDPEKHTAVFGSHTWWDRNFVDGSNDPEDKYDKGAPDWQSGPHKDLKWQLICKGVRALIAWLLPRHFHASRA